LLKKDKESGEGDSKDDMVFLGYPSIPIKKISQNSFSNLKDEEKKKKPKLPTKNKSFKSYTEKSTEKKERKMSLGNVFEPINVLDKHVRKT